MADLHPRIAALAHVPEAHPVRWVPLAEEHLPALRAICEEDTETWAIYPVNMAGEGFDEEMGNFHENTAWVNLVAIDMRTGEIAAFSNYINPNVDFPETAEYPGGMGTVEIGGTVLSCKLRGSGFNRAMKHAMISHAFACGFHRVVLNVDERNERSKAAVRKLGAVYEGTRRKDKVTWTGHVRDTAVFSILRDEWQG
ncbi:GNAT family N-acetyltransferase [Croceicoccus mobilis]|uniref:Alanine acetyltransferase n=1 Tax=Croceicoccus mobilis TaxID=1703339 RepID=A0A916Z0Q4_9SPHN|nr:GNAT family protein [Croceicoccus mobilis]GGD69696.1 alanine acetyltransferase [Croceicoccus mobilis]